MGASVGTDSNAISIHELLHDRSIYQMPLFQRRYQWAEDTELSKFWDDLTSVLDDEVDISFLGAIVLQIEREGSAKRSRVYTVIDGQQRITTFYLFLCAVVDYAFKHGYADTANDLVKQYLVSGLSAEHGDSKLIPTFQDNSNFNEVIKSIDGLAINLLPDTGLNDGPMILAFMYFSDAIEKTLGRVEDEVEREAELEKIFTTLLERMEVVQIVLDKSHNANEVFDRLNTAGRPLGTMDLVRNELFQTVSEDYERATALYQKKWEPFEKSFEKKLSDLKAVDRAKVIDGFFFPYALVHFNSAKKNNLLHDLRKIWGRLSSCESFSGEPHQKGQIDPDCVVVSLEELKGPYPALDQGIRMDELSDSFWDSISGLRRVPIPGVSQPYFMQLISSVARGNVTEQDAIAVSKVIESFFVRRGFVGLEPTGLHSIFKKLWSDAGADPEAVKENIQTGTISFPDDEEVLAGVLEKGLYGKRIEKYVLWAYEMELQSKSFAQLSYLPAITTDHVMPQEWKGEWKNVISQDMHSEIIHLWGNLVPLSGKENSAKHAKSFSEAKGLLAHETAFVTTKRFLHKFDTWGRDEILARTEELGKWAIQKWVK